MTVAEFLRLVEGATYKPGEQIRALDATPIDDAIRLQLVRYVPDSKNPGTKTKITHNKSLTYRDLEYMDLAYAKEIIYRHLVDAERHECEEFLRFHGEQYRDPHAGE